MKITFIFNGFDTNGNPVFKFFRDRKPIKKEDLTSNEKYDLYRVALELVRSLTEE